MGNYTNSISAAGRISLRRAGTAIFLVTLLTGSSSWAQTPSAPAGVDVAWKGVVAAGQKEGRVALYSTAANPLLARLKADFELANPGIVLEVSRYSTGELLSKISLERDTGAEGDDVSIATDITWAEDRLKEGAIKPPIGPSAKAWPAKYMIRNAIPVLSLEPIVIAYNTNLVKVPIEGYKDLLKPELKGKLGTMDLSATSVIAFYDWLEKTHGADYLTKFARQQPKLYPTAPSGGQSVASGEIPAISFMSPANIVPLIKQGAPVKVIFPQPRFGFRLIGVQLAWSKRPNASQVFMDYVMSQRGQAIWHGVGESASPLKNIPGSLEADSIEPYDPAPYTPEFAKAYTAKWNGLFKGK